MRASCAAVRVEDARLRLVLETMLVAASSTAPVPRQRSPRILRSCRQGDGRDGGGDDVRGAEGT